MVRHGVCSKILWFYASLRDELPSDLGGGCGQGMQMSVSETMTPAFLDFSSVDQE